MDIYPYQNPVDRKEIAAWWKELREQEDPICQKPDRKFTEVTAPQHTRDGDPSVEKAAKAWCKSMNGKTVKEGERPFNFNLHGFSSFWLNAALRKDPPKELKCGKEAKISEDDCFKSIMRAVEGCEPRKKLTHGAGLPKGCVHYVSNMIRDSNTRY